MRLLLDTHTFLWWDSAPDKLSPYAMAQCLDIRNQLVLSVVSIWEMQIKIQIGKLRLRTSLEEIITEQQNTNQFEILPVSLSHVLEVGNLPLHHRDPFDRLLISQARIEAIPLLSRDERMQDYDVSLMWNGDGLEDAT